MSLFLLFCSPTAVPRLKILPLYIPFIAIAFPFLLRKRFVFSFAIAIGTLMIFPLLWITRLSVESLSGYSINGYGDFFSSMDFDTYKTLSYVVSQNIVTNGKQLLGCFFFWLPRNIWTTKPVGSGYFIAQKYDLGFGEFYNISMNYLGEGYINFGYIGIFVFVAALAYLSARFDNYFWIRAKGDFYNPISLYYFITVGYLFFLLRGDMLSGTAYYVGIIVYVFLVKRICFKEYMEPETKASNADNLNFSQIVS